MGVQLSGFGNNKKQRLSASRQGCGVDRGRSMWGRINNFPLQPIAALPTLNEDFSPLTGQKLILWFPFVCVSCLSPLEVLSPLLCHSGLGRFCTRPTEDLFLGQKQNQVYVAFVSEPV
jgi:hypothetical protein